MSTILWSDLFKIKTYYLKYVPPKGPNNFNNRVILMVFQYIQNR